MKLPAEIPALGSIGRDSGFIPLESSSDNLFAKGRNGVASITSTGDHKVEFIAFHDYTIALVNSAMGQPAYYPVQPVEIRKPVQAVLMDLDGTSVHSEQFWIWIIEKTTGSLLEDPGFTLEEADLPYVSGHSVSEHLKYCIEKYCPGKDIAEARTFYFKHTEREMALILEGKGKKDAFTPAPGVKEFLLLLKEANIKIGLVTSGLYQKAWPEIVSAFKTLGMGDPSQFYDAIVTAGFPIKKGNPGTLGELSPKPHPWLYAEAARIGLGLKSEDKDHVVGIEDSGAGVASIRLAGFPVIGMAGGNIRESGTETLCHCFCSDFKHVAQHILEN